MQNRKRDTDVKNRLLDSVGEGEGEIFWVNSIETCILSSLKQITSPGWMHDTSAQDWFTGKTQRNRVEREMRGGCELGILVNPWLIHVNVWQKSLQCCKVISLQLIKINEKKKAFIIYLIFPAVFLLQVVMTHWICTNNYIAIKIGIHIESFWIWRDEVGRRSKCFIFDYKSISYHIAYSFKGKKYILS